MVTVHWDPQVWVADIEIPNTRRWLKNHGQAEHGEFGGPPQGADVFLWTYGPRICPGKKLSQVEVVAGVFALLRSFTLNVAKGVDEDKTAARARLGGVVMNSKHRIAMMMQEPEKAGILCLPRR